MRPWAFLSAVALFLTACGPSPPSAPPLGEPPLWHIQDEDSDIWLFGTVHVLPRDLSWRSPRLNAAFAAADELVTEADVSDASALGALATRYGFLPSGRSLSPMLSPETRQSLERVQQSLHVDAAAIEPLRPWLAGLRLSFLFAVSRGQQSDAGVEAVLVPEARARGLRLTYLETSAQQIRTLADLSEADQIRFLEASLREIEDGADTLERMQRAWALGDIAELARLSDDEMRGAGPGPYAALITRRNQVWARQIAQRLQGSGHTFYAVGAAHLLGDDSVVALLRREGVRVDGP